MKTILLILAAILALGACADPVTHGTVIAKEYDDPDTWTDMVPQYQTQCLPVTRTVYDSYSKTTRIVTEIQCNQVFNGYLPVQRHDGEHYNIKLRNNDKTGWRNVTPTEYERIKVGDYYDTQAALDRS